ncbi:MAG: hypothetical protein Q7S01_02360 [bacterium]|nr:hypothetical protein [bacterium]
MDLNKLFNRKNEPGPKKVEKSGRENMAIQRGAESRQREKLVNEYGLNQGDLDLIKEIGDIRVSKDEKGHNVFGCKYLGHEIELRNDKDGSFVLMDGKRQSVDNKQAQEQWDRFRDKLLVYSDFLERQKYIPENARGNLIHHYAYMGHPEILEKSQSEEDRAVTRKVIDDFLGRSS